MFISSPDPTPQKEPLVMDVETEAQGGEAIRWRPHRHVMAQCPRGARQAWSGLQER